MIDRLLITRKMRLILEDLAPMTQLSQLPREQYLKDSINEALAERYLERAIGRMIDVNFHLVIESGHAPPKDYHESFVLLGTLGVMTIDFAKEMAMAAGSATGSCMNTMPSILSGYTKRCLSRSTIFP